MKVAGREQADRLLAWSEAVELPCYLAAEGSMVLAGPAYYERALAAEALGRRDDAEPAAVSDFFRHHEPGLPFFSVSGAEGDNEPFRPSRGDAAASGRTQVERRTG